MGVNLVIILLIIATASPFADSSSNQCGGVLQGKTGNFQSPNFPQNYPKNVKCSWKIMVPGDNAKIIITFPKFDIEWDNNCLYDYVQILDENKKPFGKNICGKTSLKIEVPGTTAYVVLYSDDVVTEEGFQATFEGVAPPKPVSIGDCDFDNGFCKDWNHDMVDGDFKWTVGKGATSTPLTGPQNDHSGKGNYLFIESSLPRKIGDKARIITSSLHTHRCLRFYYYMYGVVGMGSLRVYIRDGRSASDTLIWSKSGDHGMKWRKAQFPIPVQSSSSFQIVIEGIVGESDYSDIAIDDIAFSNETCQLEECGGKLGGLSGAFSSPDYPGKYPDDSRCTWTINGPPGTKNIVIKFNEFNLQVDTKCSKDYVKIFNKNGTQLGPRYCGFYSEGYGVKIHGDAAEVYFFSHHYIVRSGFNATFEAILSESPDDCDFDGAKCLWNNSYLDDFDWTIKDSRTPSFFTGPSGDYLGLGKYAYIESSYRKKGDAAHLVSGVFSGARCMQFMYNLRGIHMGKINVFQEHQINRKRQLLLTKVGNHERQWHKAWMDIPNVGGPYRIIIEGVVGSGFTSDAAIDEISFTSGSCPSQLANTCGGYLTSDSGVIKSPNFPKNYPNNAVCEWVINPLPYFSHLDIAFKVFDVEKSGGCSKDNVQVEDAHRTRIGQKRCGLLTDLQQKTVQLQGTKAYVAFFSDSSTTKNGFRATYQASPNRQICGGRLHGTNGNFSSPNYPNNYPSDEVCEWEITGSDAHKWLEITFKDFVIDDTVICSYNYLLVYDGVHGNEVGRYCGMYSPAAPIIIPSHITDIRFATSQYGAARGFVAEWRVIQPNVAQSGGAGRK